jgi:small subunit ribosomal protein S6
MLVNEYETTLVLRPELAGDAIESTLDRVRDSVKKMDGTLLEINHWGRKKLAYPIEKQTRGVYVHTHYLGKDNLVAEVERNLRISDSVMRYLTIRMEQGIIAEDREVRDYVAPEYGADAEEETDGGRSSRSEDGGRPSRSEAAPAKAEAAPAKAEAAPAEAAPAEAAPVEAAPVEAASEESPATEETPTKEGEA